MNAHAPQAGRHMISIIRFSCFSLAVLTADLLTKWLAFKHVAGVPIHLSRRSDHAIPIHAPIELIPRVLSLQLTTNTGAVFGLGKGSQWLFVVVSVIASAVVLRFFYASKPKDRILHFALGLILAGALGNMYDRVRFHAVRDLLRLFPGTSLWPWIFNIADAALMIGVGLIIIAMWRADRATQHDRSTPTKRTPAPHAAPDGSREPTC